MISQIKYLSPNLDALYKTTRYAQARGCNNSLNVFYENCQFGFRLTVRLLASPVYKEAETVDASKQLDGSQIYCMIVNRELEVPRYGQTIQVLSLPIQANDLRAAAADLDSYKKEVARHDVLRPLLHSLEIRTHQLAHRLTSSSVQFVTGRT